MKKKFSEIIALMINIIMPILIFYFAFFDMKAWRNQIWTLIFGIWAGWHSTRNYYKNK